MQKNITGSGSPDEKLGGTKGKRAKRNAYPEGGSKTTPSKVKAAFLKDVIIRLDDECPWEGPVWAQK